MYLFPSGVGNTPFRGCVTTRNWPLLKALQVMASLQSIKDTLYRHARHYSYVVIEQIQHIPAYWRRAIMIILFAFVFSPKLFIYTVLCSVAFLFGMIYKFYTFGDHPILATLSRERLRTLSLSGHNFTVMARSPHDYSVGFQ